MLLGQDWTRLLYAPEMIIIAKNGNGINSVTTSDCSELSLITLKKCIVTLNCPEDFQPSQNLGRNNFTKTCHRDMILLLCSSAYAFYKIEFIEFRLIPFNLSEICSGRAYYFKKVNDPCNYL